MGIKGGGSGENGDVIISLDVRCKGSRQGVCKQGDMQSQGPSGRHARARTRGKVTVQYRNIINKQARDPRSSRTLVKEGVAGVTVPEIFQPPALAEVLRSKVPNFAVGVPFMSVRVPRIMCVCSTRVWHAKGVILF